MNKILFLGLIISAISCGKKEEQTITSSDAQENTAPYDTIATDSFSVGATPNNVVLHRDTVIAIKKDSLPKATKEKSAKNENTKTEKPKKDTKKPETKELPKTIELKPESQQPTPQNIIGT